MPLRLVLIMVAVGCLLALFIAAYWYRKRRKGAPDPVLTTVPWTANTPVAPTLGPWAEGIIGEPRVVAFDERLDADLGTPLASYDEVALDTENESTLGLTPPAPAMPAASLPRTPPSRDSRPQEWLVFHVLANPGHQFVGYDLLQTLSGCSLQHGAGDLFHYYANPTTREEVLFSVASAIEPGTFQLDEMGGFSTTGLTLFMSAKVAEPMRAFAKLLETLQQLIDDLPARIFDDKRKPCTQHTLAQYQSRLMALSAPGSQG